jgi:hypothetical protein
MESSLKSTSQISEKANPENRTNQGGRPLAENYNDAICAKPRSLLPNTYTIAASLKIIYSDAPGGMKVKGGNV